MQEGYGAEAQSLEQKYIKLLEQKVVQLEKSLEAKNKDDDEADAPTDASVTESKRRDSMVVNTGGEALDGRKNRKNKVRSCSRNENHTHLYPRKKTARSKTNQMKATSKMTSQRTIATPECGFSIPATMKTRACGKKFPRPCRPRTKGPNRTGLMHSPGLGHSMRIRSIQIQKQSLASLS